MRTTEIQLRKPMRIRSLVARSLRLSLPLVAAGLMLAGCGRGPRAPGEEIRVSGNIEVDDARLGFKIPGRLIERLVDEGQMVEAGALVARLDAVELEQQLAIRRAEEAVAEAVLTEVQAGSRTQEIAAVEAALRSAEAELERARLEFRRQEILRGTETNSERDLEAARAQVGVAEARASEVAERLALVREGPRQETIAAARARVAQAHALVALAETQVDNARLEAPFAGIALEKHAEPGEFLAAGAPVVTIADISRVWLRAYVAQADLGRIRIGQPVEVRTDSDPNKVHRGRLAFVSSEAEFTPKTVQTNKERVRLVFRVKIDLENPSGELKPGMAADAVIGTTD